MYICIYLYMYMYIDLFISETRQKLHMQGLTLEFENGELTSLGRYWRGY